MMKSILILAAIITVASLIAPWWIVVVISFLFMLLKTQTYLWKSLVVSFTSGFLAYLIYIYFISHGLEKSPAELIANLFGELPSWSAYLITALIGGLAAAFGGMSGHLGEKILLKTKT